MTSGSITDDNAEAATEIARNYIATGNAERAKDVLRAALSQHPNQPLLLAEYARAELLLDNDLSAAHSAYASLSYAPHDAYAMRIYALALDRLGRHPEALWMAWRTVTAHPHDVNAHYMYAQLLHNARQSHYALPVVNEALRLDPTDVDALVLRGWILNDLGRIRESTASYREALSLDSGNAYAFNNIAVNRVSRGRFGRALRGFLGAAALDPTLGDLARRNIGVVLTKLFRRVTLVAGFLGLLVVLIGSVHSNGEPTATLRVVTGLITAALTAILGWLLRTVPRRVLASALRDRPFVTARVVHALLGVGAGTWATIFGGSPWMIVAGGMLIAGGLLLVRVGLFIGT